MLLYASAGISELEIPDKQSLVIYISECNNKCKNCHTPYLHEKYGEQLNKNFEILFEAYKNYFDILCIMGEGKCTIEEMDELNYYCDYAHRANKKFALYCGRDTGIENWMKNFDYIKLGAYYEDKGALTIRTTNQKLLEKNNNYYKDITYMFWK